jgi:hypothetical protein
MSSYRSGITAQNRTQALFLAQYQADGLKTYRDSLDWSSDGGNVSFLNGVPANFAVTTSNITAANSLIQDNTSFCVDTVDQSGEKPTTYWKINTDTTTCNTLAKSLAPNLNDPKMKINLSNPAGSADKVQAVVEVSYKPASAADPNYREKVTNSIILIK